MVEAQSPHKQTPSASAAQFSVGLAGLVMATFVASGSFVALSMATARHAAPAASPAFVRPIP